MSTEKLRDQLLRFVSSDWRTFKDVLFAFNGARAMPVPQSEVQKAMDRLTRDGVVETRKAKSRLKFVEDDLRLYRRKAVRARGTRR